jgi:hypothetical protein
MGAPLLAATLLCFTAAGLWWLYLVAGGRHAKEAATSRSSLLRILFTLMLAVGLTVAGLEVGFSSASQPSRELDRHVQRSPLKAARALIRKAAVQNPANGPNELITTLYQPAGSIEITDKGYPGVILWPKVKATHSKLAAPPPLSWSSPLTAVARVPFSIPFTGQYWMFKPPQKAPPPGSDFRRESPLGLSFVTTDQEPMSMKALQKLDHPIDLRCCRAIQLSISNADGYFGTVALEPLLVDTRAAGQPSQSLGMRDVVSRPSGRPTDLSVLPVTEILNFSVPGSARIRQFDEIQVLFHRASFRIDRSAKISIEHFILVP